LEDKSYGIIIAKLMDSEECILATYGEYMYLTANADKIKGFGNFKEVLVIPISIDEMMSIKKDPTVADKYKTRLQQMAGEIIDNDRAADDKI
jgi:hypothetical protein